VAGAREPVTVDAHLHIWDLDRSEYGWLTPDFGPLYATFTPAQAQAELTAAGIDTAVLVQAEDSERDTDLMLEAARRHPWIAGVVGWLRLDDPQVAAGQLERWQDEPRLCGVRHLVHDDPRDDFLALAPVRQSLRLLSERGIPFDVPDAWPRHLAAAADLADSIADLRVVVDHLGKPPFRGPDWDAWRATLAAVAARPNTVAKVSGLQVPGTPFTVDAVRPAWEVALDLFGPARLMWGSDWPLTVLVGGYGHAWEVMSALIAELSADEQQQILSGTATAIYRLP
jgi:L-fucono-1,5-lactonase